MTIITSTKEQKDYCDNLTKKVSNIQQNKKYKDFYVDIKITVKNAENIYLRDAASITGLSKEISNRLSKNTFNYDVEAFFIIYKSQNDATPTEKKSDSTNLLSKPNVSKFEIETYTFNENDIINDEKEEESKLKKNTKALPKTPD